MVRTKVFVGNLSFKTGEKELAQEFEVAGKVASANIISRGSRSLGYGFVEMESEDEARKAVELLNKKLIDSREINVEVARPREENPDRNNPDRNNPDAAPGVGQRRRSGSGRKFFRQRRGGNNNVQGGPPQLDANGVPIPNAPNNNRGPNINGDNQLIGGSPSGRGGGRGGRGPRRGGRFPRGGGSSRPPRPDRPVKVAPPNSVFVANLPFKLDDDGLSSVFVNLTLKEAVKSSHVVKDRLGFSKGYGFVEFSNPDDQQKALTADKSVVDAREIIVKAAFTEPPPPKINNNNNAGASATPGDEVVVKA